MAKKLKTSQHTLGKKLKDMTIAERARYRAARIAAKGKTPLKEHYESVDRKTVLRKRGKKKKGKSLDTRPFPIKRKKK